jgi:enoyl-CoA hydratase
MGEDAFLSDPHVKYGMAATSAVQMIWPKLTSYAFAKEAAMSGREVYAQEAVRIGLANRICPTGEERATALEIAKGFAELPPSGIAATKREFNRSLIEEAAKMGLTVGAAH